MLSQVYDSHLRSSLRSPLRSPLLSSLVVLIISLSLWCIGGCTESEDGESGGGYPDGHTGGYGDVYTGDQSQSYIKGACGQGPIQLRLGYGRPFEPLQDQTLWMEYGIQGGYHVDVSLEFIGSFNPDLIDIEIQLEVNMTSEEIRAVEEVEESEEVGEVGDIYGVYGRHFTADWYLLFAEDPPPLACYFYNTRVFLFDAEGQVPTRLMIEALNHQATTLTIHLSHSEGEKIWQEYGVLRFHPPD